MIRSNVIGIIGLIAFGALSQGAHAAAVDPQAMWRDGLETIQGSFRFIQVSSPGGLWIEETTADGNMKSRQVSIGEVPAALRAKLERSEISFRITRGSSSRVADQFPTPGPRGQAPYHGHIRKYEESARGELKISGLPGIGLVDGDDGEFSGTVNFSLFSSVHSDPSDSGVFMERQQGEESWGAAAQMRNYADFGAIATGAGQDDPSAQVMANARLLRGGREIISYVDWMDPSPSNGVVSRKVRGSVRLFRAE